MESWAVGWIITLWRFAFMVSNRLKCRHTAHTWRSSLCQNHGGHHLPWPPCSVATIFRGHHLPWPPSSVATIFRGHHVPWPPSSVATIFRGHHVPWPQGGLRAGGITTVLHPRVIDKARIIDRGTCVCVHSSGWVTHWQTTAPTCLHKHNSYRYRAPITGN